MCHASSKHRGTRYHRHVERERARRQCFRHAAQRTGVGRNAAGRYRRACALGVRPVSLLGASAPVLGRPVLAAALWLLGLAPLGLARLGLAPPLGLAAVAANYRASATPRGPPDRSAAASPACD